MLISAGSASFSLSSNNSTESLFRPSRKSLTHQSTTKWTRRTRVRRVLEIARREFIRHQFTDVKRVAIQSDEHMFSISIRKLQSAVLAALSLESSVARHIDSASSDCVLLHQQHQRGCVVKSQNEPSATRADAPTAALARRVPVQCRFDRGAQFRQSQ